MADPANRTVAPEQSFLGVGWGFPPTFNRRDCSVMMSSGEQDVRESLRILFSTALGERIMLPEYGSPLDRLVFQGINTTLASQLREALRQAIITWEPRVEVGEIEVQTEATTEGWVQVIVYYELSRTNTRANLVFPFYLQEGTLVPATP